MKEGLLIAAKASGGIVALTALVFALLYAYPPAPVGCQYTHGGEHFSVKADC